MRDLHGPAHHPRKPHGGAQLQPLPPPGDERRDERAERDELARTRVPRAHALRRGQPDGGLHQGAAARAQHRVRGEGGAAGRPLGLPPPVQHRGLRLRPARAPRVERPRRRGRPHARREGLRREAHLRRGRRGDPPPLRPHRRHEPRDDKVLPRDRQGRQEVRHARLLRPQLPRHLLEGTRGRAPQGVPPDRLGGRHPRGQRGGLPALPRLQGTRSRRQGPRGEDRIVQDDDHPGREEVPEREDVRHHPPPGDYRQRAPLGRDRLFRRQVVRRGAAPDRGDGPHRRR